MASKQSMRSTRTGSLKSDLKNPFPQSLPLLGPAGLEERRLWVRDWKRRRRRKMSKMNESEKALVKAINAVNIPEVRRLLSSGSVDVNCLDEQGMTPIMHCAYKGNVEMTELLLAHGADVNSNNHEHKYTALMFSCVAGAFEVTRLLLEAGANPHAENNLGKTAGQLGAFVGQHHCVSLINNFISQEDLLYYTRPQGFEKEGKLQTKLVPSLYRYITITNINPVKLVYFLKDHMDLVENYKSVSKVLDLKCEKFIKQQSMNEIMAMKMHFYGYTVRKCGRWHDGLEGKEGIEGLLKFLVRGRPSDGFPLGMEDFIRQSIKEFDYPQCTIFQQLVTTLSPVERGSEPTALTVLTQVINGIQSADFSKCCTVCGESGSVKKCAPCKKVAYCSVNCQRQHWSTHKKHCKRLAEEHKRELAEEEEMRKIEDERRAQEEAEKRKAEEEKCVNGEKGNEKAENGETQKKDENKEEDKEEKNISDENIEKLEVKMSDLGTENPAKLES